MCKIFPCRQMCCAGEDLCCCLQVARCCRCLLQSFEQSLFGVRKRGDKVGPDQFHPADDVAVTAEGPAVTAEELVMEGDQAGGEIAGCNPFDLLGKVRAGDGPTSDHPVVGGGEALVEGAEDLRRCDITV